jgi:hypothetical protein
LLKIIIPSNSHILFPYRTIAWCEDVFCCVVLSFIRIISGWGIGEPSSWIGPDRTFEDLNNPCFLDKKIKNKNRRDALIPPFLYSFRVLPYVGRVNEHFF